MTLPETPSQKLRRHPGFLREAVVLVTTALAFWLSLAYLALPALWKRLERQNLVAGLAMQTMTKQGLPGDPINFGLVGAREEVLCAFRSAGWNLADSVTLRSSLKIAGSVAFRRPDPQAPVSPLFYQGRIEDVAFQKAEGFSAARRHHIRLWRVESVEVGARPLWLASASFDRSVGFSHYTLQVTHHIDADLDAERGFVGAALAQAGALRDFVQFAGIGPTLRGKNGGGDRYFTDGEVLVGVLRENCDLRPDEKATPPNNPPHVDLRSAIVHALGVKAQ